MTHDKYFDEDGYALDESLHDNDMAAEEYADYLEGINQENDAPASEVTE